MSNGPGEHVHVFPQARTIRKRSTARRMWVVVIHQSNGMTIRKAARRTKKEADSIGTAWRREISGLS